MHIFPCYIVLKNIYEYKPMSLFVELRSWAVIYSSNLENDNEWIGLQCQTNVQGECIKQVPFDLNIELSYQVPFYYMYIF